MVVDYAYKNSKIVNKLRKCTTIRIVDYAQKNSQMGEKYPIVIIKWSHATRRAKSAC